MGDHERERDGVSERGSPSGWIDRADPEGKPSGADRLFGSTASQASRKQVVGHTPVGPVPAVLPRFVA